MRLRRVAAPLLALLGAAYLVRRVDVVEVRGSSMAPTLRPGDRLVVWRGAIRPGDVVIASDPREEARELIKRVAGIDAGSVVLRGDNRAASTDGRAFGALPAAAVRWRAVLRYWPVDRFRRAPFPAPRSIQRLDEGGEPACAFPEALIVGDRPLIGDRSA